MILGFGPMLLLPLLGIAAWSMSGWLAALLVSAGQLWASVLLIFIAGVRRGLGLAADDASPHQLATMMALFILGVAGIAAPWTYAFGVLALGYTAVAILDPRAAKRGEVPRHFARLRPPQMVIALVGLAILFARAMTLSSLPVG
jgi:hypothetical protein